MSGIRLLCFFALAMLLVPVSAQAITYSGSLSSNDGGLTVYGPKDTGWPSQTLTFSWTVSNETGGPAAWQYDYTFAIAGTKGGISHVIIEVSDQSPVQLSEILGGTSTPSGLTWTVGELTPQTGNSNLGMPDRLRGLKVDVPDDEENVFSLTWSFYTNRDPVWGDFYAKDGTAGEGDDVVQPFNAVFNTGFTLNDEDPLVPSDGSVYYHILRPDSGVGGEPPPIPEPLTVLGLCLGVGGIAGYLRRRRWF